jgi:hypothetical protein
MEKLIEKLKIVEREIAQEKGDFILFALLHREWALHNSWHLLVSAPWFGESRLDTSRYIFGKLKPHLEDDEILKLAMVVPLEPAHEFVVKLNELYQKKQDDLGPCDFKPTNLESDYAYIIASNPELALEPA